MVGDTNMYYFNDTIYIYTVAVGSLFNNIYVQKIDKANLDNPITETPVPLSYLGKTHWYLKKHKSIPDTDNIGAVLPTMAYSLKGMQIDTERQTNKFETMKFDGNVTREVREWCQTAVPYVFEYELSIWTKRQTDMNQIIEQILPFFPAKSRDIHINEIPFLNITRSTRLVLSGTSDNIEVEFDKESDRIIKYDITFTLDGYLYQPIKEDAIIGQIDIGIYTNLLNNNYMLDATITPIGLVPAPTFETIVPAPDKLKDETS